MAPYTPITLAGENLGQRHRYLNWQVEQAAKNLLFFQDVEDAPEQTAIDRLFKIDLANKLKHIDYIVKQLKDDDMLYVSRALKSNWLIEHRDVINPKYLEDSLFPEMVMPAISKMKHWLYIHVRDPVMCLQFYLYYKDTKFNYAVKFLTHCDDEFMLNEFPKILTRLTPHYLKVFAEKCPKLVKIYFDALATDNELVKLYLQDETSFYKSIKCLLKSNPDMFFDITEKYHNLKSNKLSLAATDYIMRFHKSRFMNKPELYVVYLVHVPTAARRLSADECQDVVIRLARADYLGRWFSYKNVEPFIKRVSPDSRAAFKKRVFVDKDVGERVTEWSYVLPASPVTNDICFEASHVFIDREFSQISHMYDFQRMLKKRKYCKWGEGSERFVKTELQKLFDEFRVMGFEATLHELKPRVFAASSADRRRDLLLVLVSKSGGRADAVRTLLELAMSLRNEPVHERAAVTRSLVKRANAWRFPQDVWDTMLEYARGLGLDGSEPEADCSEGLHAVVMRQLISTGDCEPALCTVFLNKFSAFTEYNLVQSERTKLCAGLQRVLLRTAADAEPKEAANHLGRLLDILKTYQMRLESSPVVSAISALAKRDSGAARPLLIRLYTARVGRRELLRQYLEFRHDDAALLNALRHEPDAITPAWLVQLIADKKSRPNQFLLKLAVYFNEVGGNAEQIQLLLHDKIAEAPDVNLARPLATLAGSKMRSLWLEQDEAGGEHHKLAAALRAHMHRARPVPDALTLGWRQVGVKAVAWRAMRCRPAQVTQLVQTLLQERVKRTVRLALTLAQRVDCAADMFSVAVTIRPLATLRAALLYYRKFGDAADPRIWDIIKALIASADLSQRRGLRHILEKVKWVPDAIKPEYCAILYLTLSKISEWQAENIACEVIKHLAEVSDDLLENVMLRMLEHKSEERYADYPVLYPGIIIRYLMLSKSNDELTARLNKIGEPFFNKLDSYRLREDCDKYLAEEGLVDIMISLQYNLAFFDIKYEYCLPVIERVLTWMQNFMPRDMHFKRYVKIHATMLYYKAVRQSIKQNPEVFADRVKKMSEGVDIVGFTFGRYIAKEVTVLKSQYFDSIIEIYSEGFGEYLSEYIVGHRREQFIAALAKGILSESVASDARIALEISHCLSNEQKVEIEELIMKSENTEIQFFLHAWCITDLQ